MQRQTLFDNFTRVDPSPAPPDEGSFAFLNRAAGPYWERVRQFAETAFSAYPLEDGVDLRARFRGRQWSEHIGAWWELYLFTLFRALGLSIEVHPELDEVSSRPDFRVGSGDKSFLVEARHVASGIRNGERSVGQDAWITGPLDALRHPNFMVGVRILARDGQQPRRTTVTAGVVEWLDTLDPDTLIAGDAGALPTIDLQAGDWRFQLKAIPMRPEKRAATDRRLVGLWPSVSGYDTTTSALRAALKEKAAKYGRPSEPFVLAPLLTSGSADTEDLVGALFGTEAVTFAGDHPETVRRIRQRNGFWLAGKGFRGTRITGVLVGQSITPWTVANDLPRLWLHPAPAIPLALDLDLPTAHVGEDDSLVFAEGARSARELFGLTSQWPGPEPAFPRDS